MICLSSYIRCTMSQILLRSSLVAAVCAATLAAPGAASAKTDWITGWGAAQVKLGALSGLVPHYDEAGGLTLRNVVRTSAGGRQVRVRVSNVFGARAVTFDSVTVGVGSDAPARARGRVRALRSAGKRRVTIPAGGQVASDAVKLAVAAGQNLAVSLY